MPAYPPPTASNKLFLNGLTIPLMTPLIPAKKSSSKQSSTASEKSNRASAIIPSIYVLSKSCKSARAYPLPAGGKVVPPLPLPVPPLPLPVPPLPLPVPPFPPLPVLGGHSLPLVPDVDVFLGFAGVEVFGGSFGAQSLGYAGAFLTVSA